MATFVLSIELGNDAMSTSDDIAQALHDTESAVEVGSVGAFIHDVNGNRVGRFDIIEALKAPDQIASEVLVDHNIRPHWVRNGEQIHALIREAIEIDRAQREVQ